MSPPPRPPEEEPPDLAARIARALPEMALFVRRRMGRELRERESVSDIVQSTARELLKSARFEDRGDASFRRWLEVAAEHKIRNRARRWRALGRDRCRPAGLLPSETVEPRTQSHSSPSQDASAREEAAQIDRAIAALPAHYASVVRRVQLDGASYDEVACELGRTPEAVRKLLTRALARLSTLLDRPRS